MVLSLCSSDTTDAVAAVLVVLALELEAIATELSVISVSVDEHGERGNLFSSQQQNSSYSVMVQSTECDRSILIFSLLRVKKWKVEVKK